MDTILIRGRDIKYWILEPTIGTYGFSAKGTYASKKTKAKPIGASQMRRSLPASSYKPPIYKYKKCYIYILIYRV